MNPNDRYIVENDFWIKDQTNNKHLSLTDAVNVLNEQNNQLDRVNTIINDYTRIINNADVAPGDVSVAYDVLRLMNNTICKIEELLINHE